MTNPPSLDLIERESASVVIDDETVPDDQDIWEAFEIDRESDLDCSLCGDRGCVFCR